MLGGASVPGGSPAPVPDSGRMSGCTTTSGTAAPSRAPSVATRPSRSRPSTGSRRPGTAVRTSCCRPARARRSWGSRPRRRRAPGARARAEHRRAGAVAARLGRASAAPVPHPAAGRRRPPDLRAAVTVLTYQALSAWDRSADDEDVEDSTDGALAERRRAAVRGIDGADLLVAAAPARPRRSSTRAARLGPWTLVARRVRPPARHLGLARAGAGRRRSATTPSSSA